MKTVLSVAIASLVWASMAVGQAPEGPEPELEARELFRLGGVDVSPEQQFTNRLLSLAVGPNDQLFVLDVGADRVQVFSALDGRWIRSIARSGEGPGEIGHGTTIGFDRLDRLWVTDALNSRFSVFDSSGVFLRSVPRTPTADAARTGRLEFNAGGQLVEMVSQGSRPTLRVVDPASGDVVAHYESIPFDAERLDIDQMTFLSLPSTLKQALRGYQPSLVWDWAANGAVWFSRTDELRIVAVDSLGDTLRVVERTNLTRFTTAEEELVEQVRHRFGREAEHLVPRQLQAIVRLDDGRLLLQRPAELNEPGATFELLSPDGIFLGTLRTPLPVWPQSGVATTGDRLYVVGRGPYDVPIVLGLSLEG